LNKKATSRQYSTNDHDDHTITLEEYNRLNRDDRRKKPSRKMANLNRVFLHQSPYHGEGEKVW
jgi:hypothetical protein